MEKLEQLSIQENLERRSIQAIILGELGTAVTVNKTGYAEKKHGELSDKSDQPVQNTDEPYESTGFGD